MLWIFGQHYSILSLRNVMILHLKMWQMLNRHIFFSKTTSNANSAPRDPQSHGDMRTNRTDWSSLSLNGTNFQCNWLELDQYKSSPVEYWPAQSLGDQHGTVGAVIAFVFWCQIAKVTNEIRHRRRSTNVHFLRGTMHLWRPIHTVRFFWLRLRFLLSQQMGCTVLTLCHCDNIIRSYAVHCKQKTNRSRKS